MPEAEELITDAARHATIYARQLWRRHRGTHAQFSGALLADHAQRLDLLITAAFGTAYPIRVAQAPAPRTFLAKMFKRADAPAASVALPATDGSSIWLPVGVEGLAGLAAPDCLRTLALLQAMRARRDSARLLHECGAGLPRAVYLLIEAWAADRQLRAYLPGTTRALDVLRRAALDARPALAKFPAQHRPLEELLRSIMAGKAPFSAPGSPPESLVLAAQIADDLLKRFPALRGTQDCLFKDLWIGDLVAPPETKELSAQALGVDGEERNAPPRAARLPRRPQVREATENEDDDKPGAWMVQTSQPHEQAEDPIGMQRPTDRDEQSAAEEFADALSELPEARLVSTPGRAKEILLSDDVPDLPRRARASAAASGAASVLSYPEWDYRLCGYREPGARVHVGLGQQGPQEWVDRTMDKHRTMANAVRRQFESLRARRMRFRKQSEGEEIDLEAYFESRSDFMAGLPLAQDLYLRTAPARRDLAVMLLIDISGSTDAWVTADKRIIDVEREALLLVSVALQGMAAPYAVLGFSGEGPLGVAVRIVKSFEESYGDTVARRIAALEPEHYTRTGAAMRHATAELMRQPATHRLLLLLSDGKPNDVDEYEGRYGVEDMRQAVTEARLQGIHPFCLTIDRQAAAYLPAVFGAHHYALLPRPEQLPTVLLQWMKRLISA